MGWTSIPLFDCSQILVTSVLVGTRHPPLSSFQQIREFFFNRSEKDNPEENHPDIEACDCNVLLWTNLHPLVSTFGSWKQWLCQKQRTLFSEEERSKPEVGGISITRWRLGQTHPFILPHLVMMWEMVLIWDLVGAVYAGDVVDSDSDESDDVDG